MLCVGLRLRQRDACVPCLTTIWHRPLSLPASNNNNTQTEQKKRQPTPSSSPSFLLTSSAPQVVIGARGARIRGLEEQSGAKLQLVEDPAPSLRVFGLPSERREALALVREILDAETEELFPVPAKYHGLLVGKRGMTVKV
eukprot:745558-Rhodomonas_salina.3